MDSSDRVEASDNEPGTRGERLKLLAVVRGLEALEQPSRVTLITPSRYVGRGIRSGINTWRENDWRWERFGQMVDVKHADLWKRVDRAMAFHTIDCRVWNFGKWFGNGGLVPVVFEQPRVSVEQSVLVQPEDPSEPRIKPWRRPTTSQPAPTSRWSEVAASVAHQVNPFRIQPAYEFSF